MGARKLLAVFQMACKIVTALVNVADLFPETCSLQLSSGECSSDRDSLLPANLAGTQSGNMLMVEMRWLLALLMAGTAVASTAASGQSLFDAVASGDTQVVEQALESGSNVDSRAADQATPLIAATLHNQPSMVELLLSKGADASARNSGGFTPLHAAAYVGSATIARQLLAKGAPLEDADNKAGVTPLMVAGEENHADVAELLIALGADPGHPEIHGYLPITRALWKGNKDIVHLYKQHGVTCPPVNVLGGEEWYQKCLSD